MSVSISVAATYTPQLGTPNKNLGSSSQVHTFRVADPRKAKTTFVLLLKIKILRAIVCVLCFFLDGDFFAVLALYIETYFINTSYAFQYKSYE
jgi:hypothetical protein